MRIVSKFRDYYDSMQKYADYDMTPYYRNMIVKIDNSIDTGIKNSTNTVINQFSVGVCGKIYNAFSFNFYDYKLKKSFINFYYTKEAVENIFGKHSHNLKQRISIKEDDSIFIKYSTPIFIVTRNYKKDYIIAAHTFNKIKTHDLVKYDNTLESISFQEFMSPEIIYTEIQSYIKFLTKEYITEPVVSDKIKAEIHGFTKDSFRKC